MSKNKDKYDQLHEAVAQFDPRRVQERQLSPEELITQAFHKRVQELKELNFSESEAIGIAQIEFDEELRLRVTLDLAANMFAGMTGYESLSDPFKPNG